MNTRIYSERLGAISPNQFQMALTRFDLGTFVKAEPTYNGLFGQNVFLSSTAGEFVFRGKGHGVWQFPKEQFFARLIHENTQAPVPWPYLLDPADDFFGWSYAIMPRMPGDQCAEEQTGEEQCKIARAMGTVLAEMQSFTWPVAAMEFDMETGLMTPLAISHRERIEQHIRDLLTASRQHSPSTTEADIAWVDKLLSVSLDALSAPFDACVVHHDFRPGNCTLEHLDGEWRVSGVFDLHEAYFGDGEEDLPRYLCELVENPEAALAFVDEYRSRRPFRSGHRDRVQIYTLADRLVIWAYGQAHGWFEPELTLREWMEPQLKQICLILT